jgi:hypothetical protein
MERTNWSVQPTPTRGQGGPLSGVACPSARRCTAVGHYVIDQTGFSVGFSVGLAERWNGTSWGLQHTPNHLVARFSELNGIACPSAHTCLAVGDYDEGTRVVTLAERWNGTGWSLQPVANSKDNPSNALLGVACPSVEACVAVGHYWTGHRSGTLAEKWNGLSWSIQSSPNRAQGAALSAVACPALTACIAVGYYINRKGKERTLVEAWNGTSWAIQASPNPTGAEGSVLTGVACASLMSCTAVGYFTGSSGFQRILIERWNGTSWAIQPTPDPSHGLGSALLAVACSSSGACTAVGHFLGGSTQRTLVEHSNGAIWEIQSSPSPSEEGNELSAVTCQNATYCTAVGDFYLRADRVTLAERWDGTNWLVQNTPIPNRQPFVTLSGVACHDPTTCMAIGTSVAGIQGSVTLGERYSSSR